MIGQQPSIVQLAGTTTLGKESSLQVSNWLRVFGGDLDIGDTFGAANQQVTLLGSLDFESTGQLTLGGPGVYVDFLISDDFEMHKGTLIVHVVSIAGQAPQNGEATVLGTFRLNNNAGDNAELSVTTDTQAPAANSSWDIISAAATMGVDFTDFTWDGFSPFAGYNHTLGATRYTLSN